MARSYGWPDNLIETIDDDLGKSGSSTERRVGWQRLQIMIASKEVGAVFVANITRLSRQLIDIPSRRSFGHAANGPKRMDVR